MRILIYSETETAKAKLAELRAEGHHASLRNPQFFDSAQMDKACDLAIADDPAIFDAYAAAGIATERLTAEETPSEPPQSKGGAEENPKPKGRKKSEA